MTATGTYLRIADRVLSAGDWNGDGHGDVVTRSGRTGLLFPRDLPHPCVSQPELTVDQQADVHGPKLWEREPDRCCAMRKVAPLQRALEGMDAWITGIRREQSTTRENARKIEIDARRGIVRVQPLVDWTNSDVWRYIWKHSIPYNTLHDHGFPSIGCVPCTNPIEEGTDERSGRWKGTGKVECGLHGP